MTKIKKLVNKYRSIIMYLFFGVCTTLVNIISYYIFAHVIKCSVMFSTIVAWILAVLFAYITNRKWVFESKAKNKKEIFNEMLSFFSCRLATGIVDWLGMYILVEKIGFNDVVIKVIINIIVIILNYVFSKLIVFNNKKNSKIDKKEIIIYLSFLLVTFIFLINSPLHMWNNAHSDIDSSVFRTIGLMMKNGYMPYLNSFDHKGPLVYLYNYFGYLINSNGVWYIEFISLYITICYFYKIARLKCKRIISYIIVILGLTLLLKYFQWGNFVEEYALPFITVSLYYFLDYIINSKVNKKRLIICGLSFGGVLLLRPNMIATWIVFCLYILIQCIIKKNYKELRQFILYFLIGLAIIVCPIMIWLGVTGALKDFFDAYIIFNLEYTRKQAVITRSLPKQYLLIDTMLNYLNNVIIISSFAIIMYSTKDDKKRIVYLVYMILSFYMACMSGMPYDHYMMVFVPNIILPFAILFDYCNKSVKKGSRDLFSVIIIIYIVSAIIYPAWIDTLKKVPDSYRTRGEKENYVNDMVNIITQNTNKDDKISVYGNWDMLYIASSRMHATKYSYQFSISKVSEEIANNYFDELQEEMPKIVVVEATHYDERMKNFLEKNKYKQLYSSNSNLDISNMIFGINK